MQFPKRKTEEHRFWVATSHLSSGPLSLRVSTEDPAMATHLAAQNMFDGRLGILGLDFASFSSNLGSKSVLPWGQTNRVAQTVGIRGTGLIALPFTSPSQIRGALLDANARCEAQCMQQTALVCSRHGEGLQVLRQPPTQSIEMTMMLSHPMIEPRLNS